MLVSVDTISLVNYCEFPPEELLKDFGAFPKRTIFGYKWINNGLKDTYEPNITIYPTWRRNYRIRVDLELSKLFFYGYNVKLLNESERSDALNLVSKNVEQRTSIKFDAFNVPLCRIDYAINKYFDNPHLARKFIERYFTYVIPHLLRNVINSETVNFGNDSRMIKLYDKYIQMLKKKNVSAEVIELAEGLIRLEYSLGNETSVKRFAKRMGFKSVLAKTLLSQKSINTATKEMCELLNVDSFVYSDDSQIKRIFENTRDIKKAMNLNGFIDAVKEFGEDFYLLKEMKMSKSTYDRLKRECQKIGL